MAEPLSSERLLCILQKCRKRKNLACAKRVHMHICNNGLQTCRALGNYLVPTFVECGSVHDAQQVFDSLDHPNEHSWSSLIRGYVERKESWHALKLYQKMRENHVCPTKHTFVPLLKACSWLEYVEVGREILTDIVKEGFEGDPFVRSTLVDMYAKCGSLAEAQELCDILPGREIVSWTALIAGYADLGLGEEALNSLEQMQLEGLSPDSVTFVCGLKACVNLGAIDRGRGIYAKLVIEGLERDPFVSSILVDMYSKCDSLAEAVEAFVELPVRNVVSWTALIAGYVDHGLGEEALDVLEQMQLEGTYPNTVTFVCSLRACGIIGAIDRGREIHAGIPKEDVMRDPFVGTALVDMYAKCGFLAEAQDAFHELPARSIITWTALMAGYVEHGLGEEALNCLNQMHLEGIPPSGFTFVFSLKACNSLRETVRGQEIHAEIAKEGFERSFFVGNTLVHMYAKFGSLLEAQEVFDKLLVQDVVSWTALIAGYAEHGLGEEALTCLELMKLEDVSPNALTFVSSLKACGNIGAIDRGREIHAEISKKGFERDPFVGNASVHMYAECGSLAEAQKMFDELPIRDVVSWNALITGYAEHGLGEKALTCLEQMQLEGVSPDAVSWTMVILGYAEQGESDKAFKLFAQMQEQGVSPELVTFFSILKACGNSAALETGKKIHAQIHKTGGLEANEINLANALIGMYGKCGSMVDAWQVFDVMPTKDVVTWTSLSTGYCVLGESDIVFHLFERMREAGIQPDGFTFLSVLNVCSHMGLVGKALQYFEAMSKEYGISPNIFHYSSVVDLLGRSGQLDDAVAVLERMPFQPDLVAWMTVLGACRNWNNVELGRQVFESVVRLDENFPAAYILMSNIYADSYSR